MNWFKKLTHDLIASAVGDSGQQLQFATFGRSEHGKWATASTTD
jgi:hypothetical protein